MDAKMELPPVVIKGVVLEPKNELHRRKLEARQEFLKILFR